jgi:hypothetical protein
MRVRSVLVASLLAATGLAAATTGHAATVSTQAYVAGTPTGSGACSIGGFDTPAGTVDQPSIGDVCWLLDGATGQATVQIDDVQQVPVSGRWTLYTWPGNDSTVQTPLASGDFCGSATFPVVSGAKRLEVALGGTAIRLPDGTPVVSVGSTAPCPSPVHGTVTASLP